MRIRALMTLVLSAVIATGARAQATPAQPAPPAPAPAPAPRADSFSRAPKVDSAKDAAIRKLLDAMGVRANMESAIQGMIDLYKRQMTAVPPDFWAQVQTESSTTELIDLMIPIYDRHYSMAEVQALTEFYNSPTGRKFVAEQPVMMQESMAAGERWGRELGERIMKKLRDAGYKTPNG